MSYKSGADSFLKGAYENSSVWSADADSMAVADSTEFAFGQGVDISVSRNQNKSRIYGTGSRNAQSTVALQYSGTATINGSVSNFYWLLGTLGSNVDGGVATAYTHTYTESNTLPTFTAWRRLSFDTANNEIFQGCVVNQTTITAAVNEAVKFSLECPFRYSKIDTASESAVNDTQKVYTFAGGTVEIPNGTTIAAVQNFELTMVNAVELLNGLGSRFAQGFVAKNREYNFKFTAAIQDFTLLKQFYDGSTGTAPGTDNGEMASLKLTFVNGDGHTAVATFTGVHFNEDTLPTSPNELIKEDITGWCTGLTDFVYTNETEEAPAEATL